MPLFSAFSPFDSDVDKATSELNAKEDISLMRDICQRCQQSANGAQDLLRSIVKRLNNKVPHVCMHALTFLDVGVIYGGLPFRQEVASRDFVSECRTLITNGKTHTKVIKRLKHLIRKWAENEFKSDPALMQIPSLFNSLRSEGHSFPVDEQAVDVIANQEEDDIAKAIALSLKDASGKQSKSLYPTTDSVAISKSHRQVRALYDFEAAEDNELTFKAGELVYILDDSDTNWWKGSSHRGEGLFPANFVTADLTAEPEPEISQSKSRKSVRFHEEVDVKLVDSIAAEVVNIDERKIDEALTLIQNADPTQDVDNDAPELLTLEDQCSAMGPLIDQELEKIDRQHNMLVEVNSQLLQAFTMYHSLMQQLPNYAPLPHQSYDSPQSTVMAPVVHSGYSTGPVPVGQPPCLPSAGYVMTQSYLPNVSHESPQHIFTPPDGVTVIGPGNIL